MTYEERIAAAQAKMEAFKAKMAAAAEKAKAAHTMKKEEIAAAIEQINADLDELDEAIAEEFSEFDAAVNDQIATIEGDLAAEEENSRLARERRNSKIFAIKLKAQMKAEALKERIADKQAEREKAEMECYILDLLDYAQYCQQIAFSAAIEADLTLLDAAAVAAEYVEKYGEPETEDAAE